MAIISLATIAALQSCRAPAADNRTQAAGGAPAAPGAPPQAAEGGSRPSAVAEGPPAVERACTRDEECAVARIEAAGANACCPACGTTPGTRRWHADLQRYCA